VIFADEFIDIVLIARPRRQRRLDHVRDRRERLGAVA
jgi:hypothetical protein